LKVTADVVLDPPPVCDAVLAAHVGVLGSDLTGYRHHVYRVVNLCVAQNAVDGANLELVAVAAVFHDLGIWTHGTFDYLGPSVALARAHLERHGQAAWCDEVSAMILDHHKLRPCRGAPLVEVFRRADWIDVTGGVRHFGVGLGLVRALYDRWPSAGFHRRLVALSLARLRSHPWSPLPMVRF
jgi:hypothetical protein